MNGPVQCDWLPSGSMLCRDLNPTTWLDVLAAIGAVLLAAAFSVFIFPHLLNFAENRGWL